MPTVSVFTAKNMFIISGNAFFMLSVFESSLPIAVNNFRLQLNEEYQIKN
jgi:hypothetical protein